MFVVYLVPDLNNNLISVGQLTEHAYKFMSRDNAFIILVKFPSRKIIAKIKMTKNRMFPLTLRNVNKLASYEHYVITIDDHWLWHLRFGHLHFDELNLLHHKQMVKGLLVIHEPTNSC